MLTSRRAAVALLVLSAAAVVAITVLLRRTTATPGSSLPAPARLAESSAIMEQAQADFYSRRFEDAARRCREALKSVPRDTAAALLLADVYAQSGRGDEGLSQALSAVDPQGDPRDRAGLGRIFAAAGKKDEALRIAERLAADPASASDGALAFDLGLVYAALDMREPAFRWFETAAAKHNPALSRLRDDPRLDALRGDPRYLALLAKLDLLK